MLQLPANGTSCQHKFTVLASNYSSAMPKMKTMKKMMMMTSILPSICTMVPLPSPKKHMINQNWVLLDSESTVNIFSKNMKFL